MDVTKFEWRLYSIYARRIAYEKAALATCGRQCVFLASELSGPASAKLAEAELHQGVLCAPWWNHAPPTFAPSRPIAYPHRRTPV